MYVCGVRVAPRRPGVEMSAPSLIAIGNLGFWYLHVLLVVRRVVSVCCVCNAMRAAIDKEVK